MSSSKSKKSKSNPTLAPPKVPISNQNEKVQKSKSKSKSKSKTKSKSNSSSPNSNASSKKLSEINKVTRIVSEAYNKITKRSKKDKPSKKNDNRYSSIGSGDGIDDIDGIDGTYQSNPNSQSFNEPIDIPQKLNPTTHTADESNLQSDFIAFDDGFSDAAESMHTTFKEFEDEVSLWATNDSDEDEEDNQTNKTSSLKSKKSIQSIASSEFPWVHRHDHSNEKEVSDWLTLEIIDFVDYMSPSAEEIVSRNNAVQRVRDLVKSLWPDADIHVFGSFATDLYLPGSDIDMVVLSRSGQYCDKRHLYQLSSKLRSSKISLQMEVIAKAKVPIIKLVEREAKIPIDISFERRNGVEAVQIIRGWVNEFPCLRYLAIIIKYFLARRRLNEVHSGGLGGFTVICLIVSFLKNHPKISSGSIDPMENLGVLLIEFFELYGKFFNYDSLALCMRGEMPYLRKDQHPDLDSAKRTALSVQDPNDEANNLSRGSFNMPRVKTTFGAAFDILTSRCYELESLSYKDRLGKSILGNVIKFKGPERDFTDSRAEVKSEYELNYDNYLSMYGNNSREGTSDINSREDIIIPSDFDEDEEESPPKKKKKSKKSKSSSPKPKPKPKQASAKQMVEYYNMSESDSNSNSDSNSSRVVGTTPSKPITFDSDDSDDENDSQDSRVSTLIDKSKKREYWTSKGTIV